MTNSLTPPPKKVKLAEQEAPPLLTAMLVIVLVVTYWVFAGKDTATMPEFAFKPSSVMELLATQQWQKLAQVWWSGNFGSINLWQLAFSMYWLGVFGVPVEKRVGPARFLLFIILGTTIPWVVQYWDTANAVISIFPGEHTSKLDTIYIGSFLMTSALAGAYLVVAPPKKADLTGGMPRNRFEIFSKKVEKPVSERYGLKPLTFISCFCVYQVGMHAAMIYLWPGYDVGGVFSGFTAGLIGYGIASYLKAAAVEAFQDSPMKLEAIRRYNELLDLDVTSDDAIKGSARAMGLPVDQVRLWVSQAKNKLRIS